MYPSDAMMLETAAQHLLDISSRVTASFFLFVSFLFLLYQLLLRQSNPTVCASSWKGSTVVPIRLLTSVCRAQINCCSGYRRRGLISWATYHCRHFHSQKGELKRENKTVITSVFLKKSTGIGLHSGHQLLLRTLSVWLHLRGLGKKI